MEIVAETLGVDGTYTNRFVHFPTSQLVLGPHVITPTTRSSPSRSSSPSASAVRRDT